MSDTTPQEPTMEEILASIRRIISEDDTPAADAEPAEEGSPEPAGEVAAFPSLDPEPEDEDVLELTERVDSVGDLDVYAPGPAEERPAPVEAAPPPPSFAREPEPDLAPVGGLVGDPAASAAAYAFGQLSSGILLGNGERTLEDIVRELLRPLLKQWLDDNLPRIVEQTVAEEVERIARNRPR